MRRKWWIKVCAVLCLVMLAFVLLPGLAFAEEAPAAMPEGSPWWAHLVYVIVTGLVGTLALPYLARKAQAAKQEVEKLRAEGLSNGVQARHILVADLKRFLIDYCATLLEERLPRLLPLIASSQLSAEKIKNTLRSWGKEAKLAAVEYFKTQGLDIVALVGDAYLDQAVRWAADRVSPFPGLETATMLAEKKWTNKLIAYGIDWVRESCLKQEGQEGAVSVP